jgi:histidyl-tRNA synthetase
MVGLKTPKGTADESPAQVYLYEEIIAAVRRIFTLYGAVPISTPTFELKELLMNKYGEEAKLIYDLQDQGGELCALRYDLTVPFARYLASNSIKRIKRYQIGKVYRRDNPSAAKGRLREFVQADFDIAGQCTPMAADAEIISCADRILREVGIGEFVIKVSDRRILGAILEVAGIEEGKHSSVCSTIDKIEKLSARELTAELSAKGLLAEQIETIMKYIRRSGGQDLLDALKADVIYESEMCKKGVESMEELLRLCRIMECDSSLKICLSLARGLDYYTGLIMEAEYKDCDVGAVAGGGRYDNLIENMLQRSGKVECVGFSVGITRLFSVLEGRHKKRSETVVYVGAFGQVPYESRLRILKMLWDGGIPAETFYTKRSNLSEQKAYAKEYGIPFLVAVGDKELAERNVKVFGPIDESVEVVEMGELVEYIRRHTKC